MAAHTGIRYSMHVMRGELASGSEQVRMQSGSRCLHRLVPLLFEVPREAAKCSGVKPPLVTLEFIFLLFGSALWRSRRWTHCKCPFLHASCSGLTCRLSRAFASAFHSSRTCVFAYETHPRHAYAAPHTTLPL